MSISLIGIIWVQIYWIHNGIKVKEAQFDQLVYKALNNVIVDLENDESVDFIHKQLSTTEVVIDTNSTKHKTIKKQWVGTRQKTDSTKSETGFSFDFNSDNGEDEFEMKISVNGETQTIDLKNKLEKVEEILTTDSIINEGNDELVFSNRFENIIIKMVKEFKDIDDPITHLLEKSNVDSIISSNLNNSGIQQAFSYAVIHGDSVVKEFSSENFISSENTYKVGLFKNQLLDKSAQLGINFGNKRHYILQSMWLMLGCSVLFTLIIIFTFASTLYYMVKQKKLSEIKNDFINNMTHEFKTPLSTISLAVDSITHPQIIKNEEQINYYANIIRQENKRMNTQIESVLNTSLAEKNELTLNKTAINIDSFVTKISDRVSLQVEAVDALFNVSILNEGLTLFADENHLQNTICNLVDNALKYSSKSPEVLFSVFKAENFVCFAIKDNGIGMSKETQQKFLTSFIVLKQEIYTIQKDLELD